MTTTRDQAIELLNDAKLAIIPAEKVNKLKSLQELVIKKDPSLIADFLPEVMALQAEPSAPVRKALLDFYDAAMVVSPRPDVLKNGLECISNFLHDSVQSTVKRAVVSAYPTYRAVLTLLAVQGLSESPPESQRLWELATAMKDNIKGLIVQANANTGVRMSGCKYIEQSILLLTADQVPAVPGLSETPKPMPMNLGMISKALLMREGEALVSVVASNVKSVSGGDMAAAVASTWIRTATTIIQQRPLFFGRILPPLLASATALSKIPETDAVRGALVTALKAALSLQHPIANAWRKKVEGALALLGVVVAAPASAEQTRPPKRPREEETLSGSGPGPGPYHQDQGRITPTGVQPNIRLGDHWQQTLQNATKTLCSSIVRRDAASLATFLRTLEPGVLADVVLLYLQNLPARMMVPPDLAPHEPWLEELQSKLWGQAVKLEVDATAAMPVASVEPNVVADGSLVKMAPLAEPFEIPDDVLAPIHFTEVETAMHRQQAMMRVLNAKRTSSPELQRFLIARLAATAPETDNMTQAVILYLFMDFHRMDGLDLALSWLYMLFAEVCDTSSASDGEGSGAEVGRTPDLAGTRYEDIFLSLLEACKDRLPPSDRALVSLLVEAPAIPSTKAQDFLVSLSRQGGDWSTLGLIAVRDIALMRPPDRGMALKVALKMAVETDTETRTKAVRLLANRFYSEPSMMQTIQEFAIQELHKLETKGEICKERMEEGQQESWNPAAHCALYCALCIKDHSLLRDLAVVYASAVDDGKASIRDNVPGLARTLGAAAPALLNIIEEPPPGSLDMLLAFVEVLTQAPPYEPNLVKACLKLFDRCKDARILAPVLPGMDKMLGYLPAVLDLPGPKLKETFARLISRPESGGEAVIFPAELLSALHTIDGGGDSSLLRKAMAGIQVCINSTELFPMETLAAAINQLLTRVPLPQLFMRTVIQCLAAAPKLREFVIGVLGQLAAKGVWNDKTQWRGWVMAAQQTMPESYPTWLQLPTSVLEQALASLPPDARTRLVNYALSPECAVSLSTATKEVLLSNRG